MPPVHKPNGEWVWSDEEKADVFAQHLKKMFKAEPAEDNNDRMDFINAQCPQCQMSPPIKVFTPLEVKAIIRKVNTCKVPGYNLVSGLILKQLRRKIILLLTTIFNHMLTLAYFSTI